MTANQAETGQPAEPVLRVVAGAPTAEELAALTIVVAALRRERGKPHAPKNPRIAGGWRSYWHLVRSPMFPGVDAWRSTLRR